MFHLRTSVLEDRALGPPSGPLFPKKDLLDWLAG